MDHRVILTVGARMLKLLVCFLASAITSCIGKGELTEERCPPWHIVGGIEARVQGLANEIPKTKTRYRPGQIGLVRLGQWLPVTSEPLNGAKGVIAVS